MVDLSTRGRPRFKTCANRHNVFGLTRDAVGIGHHKPALVIGSGFEIEEASRKTIGHDVLERVLVDALVPDAQERESFFPCLLPLFAIGNSDRSVRPIIALRPPFEPDRYQG